MNKRTPRRRAAGRAPGRQLASTLTRLRNMIAAAQRELVDLEEADGLSPRARAERHSRLWGLKAQLALATGAALEAERASAEQARWQAEARLPDLPPITNSATDEELDAAAERAVQFLREAKEAWLAAGYPEAAVDRVILDARPPADWTPPSIPALVEAARGLHNDDLVKYPRELPALPVAPAPAVPPAPLLAVVLDVDDGDEPDDEPAVAEPPVSAAMSRILGRELE